MHSSRNTLCSPHSCLIFAPPNDRTLFSTQHLLSCEPQSIPPSRPQRTTIMPPLTLKTSHHGEWECTTCGEEYNKTNDKPWETADGRSLVCAGCIIQQFEKALENDFSWPARFGAAALDISDFESMLPARLRLLLLLKVEQYANRRNDDSRMEAARDLTRGVDYQLCPCCGKIVTL
jgi:hypothetical protein